MVGVPGQTWMGIDVALRFGWRGLAGGSSLTRLLVEAGLLPKRKPRPPLQVERILPWAAAEYQSTGKWPTLESGRVRAAPEESWKQINWHLQRGGRGLPGGATLAGVLRLYRDILSRAHWGGPLSDGQQTVESPEKLVALLVARGALREPEIMKIIRQQQKEFQQQSLTDNKAQTE